jgi:hypothetical protein
MLPLPTVTLLWVSTAWGQKHSRMNLPVETENQRIKILGTFTVMFSETMNSTLIECVCLGSSYVASPDGSRTPVSPIYGDDEFNGSVSSSSLRVYREFAMVCSLPNAISIFAVK